MIGKKSAAIVLLAGAAIMAVVWFAGPGCVSGQVGTRQATTTQPVDQSQALARLETKVDALAQVDVRAKLTGIEISKNDESSSDKWVNRTMAWALGIALVCLVMPSPLEHLLRFVRRRRQRPRGMGPARKPPSFGVPQIM
jgi:outer membrane murein-binding lipoprotein Lpp